MRMQGPTTTVEVDFEMASFIAEAIATAYPRDTAARDWFEIADRLKPDDEGESE